MTISRFSVLLWESTEKLFSFCIFPYLNWTRNREKVQYNLACVMASSIKNIPPEEVMLTAVDEFATENILGFIQQYE